eukprot:2998848-Rhodomonas_salina.1
MSSSSVPYLNEDEIKNDAAAALDHQAELNRLVLKYGISHARARLMCWKALAGNERCTGAMDFATSDGSSQTESGAW